MVLLIDDSADIHRLITARLVRESLEVIGETDPRLGIERAIKDQPSLILLDLDMPEMDGFQVIRELKDREDVAEIPIIVLSGMQSSQDKVTAFDLGAVDFVTKPFDLTELRVRVRAAIKMRELLRMLAQKAQIDGLTGLWNRAYFDERWSQEWQRRARSGGALTLALLDLDHFKKLNDTHGHPAGDEALQAFARVITDNMRQSDIACRYGGEEFVIIMPDTSPNDAFALCERVRLALENRVWPKHPNHGVTVSIGLYGAEKTCDLSPEAWIERADKCLYRAKQEGRNRTVPEGVTRLSKSA